MCTLIVSWDLYFASIAASFCFGAVTQTQSNIFLYCVSRVEYVISSTFVCFHRNSFQQHYCTDFKVTHRHPKDVAIERSSPFVDRRFPPSSSVISERTSIGNRRIQPGDLQRGVGGRGTVSLHGDEPRRWELLRVGANWHAQGDAKIVGENAWDSKS